MTFRTVHLSLSRFQPITKPFFSRVSFFKRKQSRQPTKGMIVEMSHQAVEKGSQIGGLFGEPDKYIYTNVDAAIPTNHNDNLTTAK